MGGGVITLIKFTVKQDPYTPTPPGISKLPTIEYIAEEGMTFKDFIYSEYNVDGWTLREVYNGSCVVSHQFDGYIVDLNKGYSIHADTVIDNDGVYGWY